ncbi:MAG: hypothetical protein IJJ99_10655 [Oscillospiraceae bacterium]|nr:hypothetical protein [Oscillospiraceae bacterium]
MLALYIILAILALIVLLLALPLRIDLRYAPEQGFRFRVKYLFLTLADSTKEKKPKKPKQPAGEEKPAAQKKKAGGGATEKLLDLLGLKDISSKLNFKRAVGDKGLVETINGVFAAFGELFARIGRLVKKSVFKRFDLRIAVGDSDAADCAFRYGMVCAAVYPLLTLLDGTMKFKKRSVDIGCDFEQDNTTASFEGQLNYRPIHIVGFLLGLFGRYIRQSVRK